MAIDVFISVGRTGTPEQEAFVVAIENHLRVNGLNPRALGRSDWSSEQPLKYIQKMMSQCSGTVVIAFERMHISNGTERRGTRDEKRLDDVKTPTVWNQIEAGMAYQRGHPLLVVVENSLREEGLLERGYDWWVQSVPLGPEALQRSEFAGVFADWKKRVEAFSQQKSEQSSGRIDVEKITAIQIIRALTPAQLWAVILALGITLAATAGLAFRLGMIAGARSESAASNTE